MTRNSNTNSFFLVVPALINFSLFKRESVLGLWAKARGIFVLRKENPSSNSAGIFALSLLKREKLVSAPIL
jgi:hypothetical protein